MSFENSFKYLSAKKKKKSLVLSCNVVAVMCTPKERLIFEVFNFNQSSLLSKKIDFIKSRKFPY